MKMVSEGTTCPSGQVLVEWNEQGPEGPAGPEGDSAYEVAVDEGFEGDESEWLEGLEGPQGEPGPEGGSTPQVPGELYAAATFVLSQDGCEPNTLRVVPDRTWAAGATVISDSECVTPEQRWDDGIWFAFDIPFDQGDAYQLWGRNDLTRNFDLTVAGVTGNINCFPAPLNREMNLSCNLYFTGSGITIESVPNIADFDLVGGPVSIYAID
jgi:hypothetical protein